MATSPITKLLQKDRRLYAFALILVMLIVLIYIFLVDINNSTPELTPTGVVIYENDSDGINVDIEREVTDEEKEVIKNEAAKITDRDPNKINVEVANPYQVSDENQEVWEQKITKGEELADNDIYLPSPKDVDTYDPNQYSN
jgi:hypothetical protein